jgi:hypothetical protein
VAALLQALAAVPPQVVVMPAAVAAMTHQRQQLQQGLTVELPVLPCCCSLHLVV